MDEAILFNMEYCVKLFKRETMERMAFYFKRLMEGFIRQPNAQLGAVDILSPEERDLLLHAFNDTTTDYPKDKTIPQLFREAVNKAGTQWR